MPLSVGVLTQSHQSITCQTDINTHIYTARELQLACSLNVTIDTNKQCYEVGPWPTRECRLLCQWMIVRLEFTTWALWWYMDQGVPFKHRLSKQQITLNIHNNPFCAFTSRSHPCHQILNPHALWVFEIKRSAQQGHCSAALDASSLIIPTLRHAVISRESKWKTNKVRGPDWCLILKSLLHF